MKSNLLSLAAFDGTTITLATPANGAESPAAAQVRLMEQLGR